MFTAKILTLFPAMFPGALGHSLAGRALQKSIWNLDIVDIRNFAKNKHKTVDAPPFGGGAGMVIKPDIVSDAIEASKPHSKIIFMSPRGKKFNQKIAKSLVQDASITVLCGRYEGIDQRVIDYYQMEEISIGDYVLSGGEVAAMVLIDACVRLLPNVMGNCDTTNEESFENNLLEYPHYTRPAIWNTPDGEKITIPEILTSGHHKKIKNWRLEQAKNLTKARRPDLWEKYNKNNK